MPVEPSPEVKAILKGWVAMQREKYGENWKEILAAEMAAKTTPVLTRLVEVLGKNARPHR